jgi:lysosomal Pro-X carboxypeptidase
VTLYLNNTGLMWELAPRYNALLVFAEHRFYGAFAPTAALSTALSLLR